MNKAVLLVNLGSPDSTAVSDVRRYLNEFLMDRRVIDTPWLLRRLVVGMILIARPRQSAHAYQSIWMKEGSPLIVTSRNVREKLQERVPVPVELAMRYQNPSIEDALRRLAAQQVNRTFLIPLFPHYAMSSYETAVVRVQQAARTLAPRMEIVVQPPYGDAPDYVAALAVSASNHLEAGYDHLLFSFHGIPERHLRKSDPTGRHCLASPNCCETASPAHATCYRAQCLKTVTAFVGAAGVPAGKFSVSFQSRLGRDPWLKPYTDQVLAELPQRGVKRLLVICPAFVSDCLETLEEIGLRGRETFLTAGGEDFAQIPCLNEHPLWIVALEKMVRRFLENQPLV
ncbi:MAG TPA: ferrochelatase [Candidatus Acidoferrum sp.]|nr:ferrochelatase [Candidatus Acidoferrum sp.]